MRAERKDVEDAIGKLSGGKELVYKLAETFGGEFAHIVLNKDAKGGKYSIVLEEADEDKPTGKKSVFMSTDKVPFIAKWINDMWGEPV